MKYLIFDTETTGFPKQDLDWDNPLQARICQLAWVLVDDSFRELTCFKSLINSMGRWTISEGAQKAHGISQLDCDKYGLPMYRVLPLFLEAIDSAHLIIAHNIQFDQKMIDIECDALMYERHLWNIINKHFCTMNAMTPHCKLEQKNGKAGYKWPKLSEAYTYCFGEELKDAHDALVDVRATTRIVKWLHGNRCLPMNQT